MTVARRHASTVFDRTNLTIVDVVDMSEPVPVSYQPEDLFGFYNRIFAIDTNSTNWNTSTPFNLLLTLSSYLQPSSAKHIDPFGLQQVRLQEILATPLVIYNDGWLGKNISIPDMGKSLALAIPSYRVIKLSLQIGA